MKSVLMQGNGAVAVVEVDEPKLAGDQVLVETAASAICGSELKAYRTSGQESGNSGHEAAGTVAAVGPDACALQVGQRVGVSAVVGCGSCEYCERGQYTWCPDRTGYGSMHAERFAVSERACHVLPDDVHRALTARADFAVGFDHHLTAWQVLRQGTDVSCRLGSR